MVTFRDADGNVRSRPTGENWSGEATRQGGFRFEEGQVGVNFSDEISSKTEVRKEQPIWMAKSTVTAEDDSELLASSSLEVSLKHFE